MVMCAKKYGRSAVVCAVLWATLPHPAAAIELLTNGGFEAAPVNNRPPGWTTFEQSGSVGRFYLDAPGTTAPSVEFANQLDTPGNVLTPGGGATYAVSIATDDTVSNTGPGAHALSQSFSLPGNATNVTLRYQFFTRDYFRQGVLGGEAGLDYTKGTPNSITGEPINNHARIDILRGNASPLSTDPADIIRTIKTPFVQSNEAWENQQVNITGGLQFGQNYTIRFAAVSNKELLAFGVDNVSIDYTGSIVIPEASTMFLFALPALFLFACGMAKQSRYTQK